MVFYSDGRCHKEKGKLKNDKDKEKDEDQDKDKDKVKDKDKHKHKDLYDFEAAGKVWESYSRGGLGSEIRTKTKKKTKTPHDTTRQKTKTSHDTARRTL